MKKLRENSKDSEERLVKKKDIIILGCVLVVVLLLSVSGTLKTSRATPQLTFAEAAREAFITSNLGEYTEHVRSFGLDDLSFDIESADAFEISYSKAYDRHEIECEVTNFTSDQIDSYFTTSYNGKNEQELESLMSKIAFEANQKYTYELDQFGTVRIQLTVPTDEISISTSAGRVYEFTKVRNEDIYYRKVEIDGDRVFYTGKAFNSVEHKCEECSAEGTEEIIGFSGATEYYCQKHFEELVDIMKSLGLI